MSAYAYVHMPGYGLMPVRQCRHCGDLFVVLETAQHFPDYCPGKSCKADAKNTRSRTYYAKNRTELRHRAKLRFCGVAA